MANIRNLKKDINYVLGDIIEVVDFWALSNPEKDDKKAEAIIDDAIAAFDELMVKVNTKDVEDKKKHFKEVKVDLETKGRALIDRINKL